MASALPAGPAVLTTAGVSDRPQLAGVAPIAGSRWRALVGISEASLRRRVWQEMWTIAVPLLALLAASALAGLLVARRVWQPLAALAVAVRGLAPGEFTPLPVRSTDEAGALSQAFKRSEPRWRDRLGARDISIEVSAEAGPLPPVAGERASLEEMMAGLLLNAVEATPEGGRITVRLWASRGAVHCAVSDRGAGMPEEELRRSLQPFFTTKGSRRAGLGLSVSHGIVQRHGGTLNIESAPGLGTTVTISLPAAPAQAGPEVRPGEGGG